MADLTQDELTVLLIAAEGERMMPIGRWEAPAQSLLTKGYLQRNVSPQDPSGMYNLTITSAGRKACAQGEDDSMRALVAVGNEIVLAHRKIAARAEELWSDADYNRARNSMIDILRGDGWNISGRGCQEFDSAFKHAIRALLPKG